MAFSAEGPCWRSAISHDVEQVDLVCRALRDLETRLATPCIQTHLQPGGYFKFRSLEIMAERGPSSPAPDACLLGLFALVQVNSVTSVGFLLSLTPFLLPQEGEWSSWEMTLGKGSSQRSFSARISSLPLT